MAYFLTVKKKDKYKLLDISTLEEFQRLSNLKSSYSLEEIDLFTSKFTSEIELKTKLYEQGIITIEDIAKDISIRTKYKDDFKKVMYDLVYSYKSKYLNEEYLRNIILSLCNDKTFLNKLLNHYNDRYRQEFLAEIRARLDEPIENSIKMFNAVDAFFKDEIYDVDYKTGLIKIRYKSLHDLAMFVENYISKRGKSQVEIDLITSNRKKSLEELQKSLDPNEVKKEAKPYTRVKKPYNLDGQTSFF